MLGKQIHDYNNAIPEALDKIVMSDNSDSLKTKYFNLNQVPTSALNNDAGFSDYESEEFDIDFEGKDTDALSEGVANVYFTETRANASSEVVANTSKRHEHANKAMLDTVTNTGAGDKFLSNDGIYRIPAGGGTVVGPTDPTGNNNIVLFDGTNGDVIKDSLIPASSVTLEGNTFNGAEQLVKTDASGIIPASTMPNIAIKTFLGVVDDETAMLALVGEKGDWCTRSDEGNDFIVIGDDTSVIGSWRGLSGGSGGSEVHTISANTTLDNTYEVVLASGEISITLPTAVDIKGVTYTIKNTGTDVVTIETDGTETIDGGEGITISDSQATATIISDNANWHII